MNGIPYIANPQLIPTLYMRQLKQIFDLLKVAANRHNESELAIEISRLDVNDDNVATLDESSNQAEDKDQPPESGINDTHIGPETVMASITDESIQDNPTKNNQEEKVCVIEIPTLRVKINHLPSLVHPIT